MKLYLVQHAKAVSTEVNLARPLSEEGRKEMQKIAEFIKPLNLCVDYLWHSDKKRAAETAELLAKVVKVNKSHTGRSGLGPNDDVMTLKEELTSGRQDIMIVGHMPFLGKLSSLLLAGSESAGTVVFKNAGILCLSRSDENHWQIDWMVIPELLTSSMS
jgi:phosphohistidine phosphatase